jgi:hypothetical protein
MRKRLVVVLVAAAAMLMGGEVVRAVELPPACVEQTVPTPVGDAHVQVGYCP